MKHRSLVTLSLAPLSLALLLAPALSASAQMAPNYALHGTREAMRMVPATAGLNHGLDADKVADGYQFHARLDHKVRLDNGTELPSGTLLVGKVSRDDMNEMGTSKLALRFTQAVLKSGQTIPIKATIVGIDNYDQAYGTTPVDEAPNSWNNGTLAIDQLDVMSGVDLHSSIASKNSGVLVSTKKDVRLRAGDQLELAIAALTPHQQAMRGM